VVTLNDIIKRKLEEYDMTQAKSPLDDITPATSANDRQVGGSHYKDMDPQPWDVMEALLTREEFLGFVKGNLIKYAMRQGKKDSPDAGKYHHYKQKYNELRRRGYGSNS
jgi:hypothetical protein